MFHSELSTHAALFLDLPPPHYNLNHLQLDYVAERLINLIMGCDVKNKPLHVNGGRTANFCSCALDRDGFVEVDHTGYRLGIKCEF